MRVEPRITSVTRPYIRTSFFVTNSPKYIYMVQNQEQGICGASWMRRGPVVCPVDCKIKPYCDSAALQQSLPDLRTLISNMRSKDNNTRLKSKLQFARFRRLVGDAVEKETRLSGFLLEQETRDRCAKQQP